MDTPPCKIGVEMCQLLAHSLADSMFLVMIVTPDIPAPSMFRSYKIICLRKLCSPQLQDKATVLTTERKKVS